MRTNILPFTLTEAVNYYANEDPLPGKTPAETAKIMARYALTDHTGRPIILKNKHNTQYPLKRHPEPELISKLLSSENNAVFIIDTQSAWLGVYDPKSKKPVKSLTGSALANPVSTDFPLAPRTIAYRIAGVFRVANGFTQARYHDEDFDYSQVLLAASEWQMLAPVQSWYENFEWN